MLLLSSRKPFIPSDHYQRDRSLLQRQSAAVVDLPKLITDAILSLRAVASSFLDSGRAFQNLSRKRQVAIFFEVADDSLDF